MFDLKNVTFSYDSANIILDDVSMKIEKGVAAAITGNNGCGKTTLLRLLNGLSFPNKGKYFFDGTEINFLIFVLRKIFIVASDLSFKARTLSCFAGALKTRSRLARDNSILKNQKYERESTIAFPCWRLRVCVTALLIPCPGERNDALRSLVC